MSAVLGALFAILLGLLAVRPFVMYEMTAAQNVENAATAQEMQQIASAAQAYIQANYAVVEANATAATPATITVPMLQATGYLSASASSVNPWGQTWIVQVLQPTAGQLEALVLSSGGSAIPEQQAPAIAALTGQEGGFVPYNGQYGSLTPTIAQGAYDGWSVSMTGFSNPGAGHLAALLAFNAGNLENDYLYRVAVPGEPQLNTMDTALNMGTNDVNNAGNVQANGNVGVAGKSPTSGLPAGWTGVHSTSVYADGGDVGSGADGNVLAYLAGGTGTEGVVAAQSPNGQYQAAGVATNGESYFEASNSSGAFASMVVPNGDDSEAYLSTNGGMYVLTPSGSNAFYALNDGLSYTSWGMELGDAGGSASAGTGCSPNGTIASNANGTGALMECVNGAWQSVSGGFTSTFQMDPTEGTMYQNTGPGPMFIASDCAATPGEAGYSEVVGLFVYDSQGNLITDSRGEVAEGGSDSEFNAIPSASTMVPAGDYFAVVGNNEQCDLAVSQ